MALGIWFWILLAIALIWGFLPEPSGSGGRYWRYGTPLLWFLLFLILGLAQFGGPIKG